MKRKGCIETDFTFVEFKETIILCSIILQKEKKIKLLYESVLNKFSACGRTFCTSWIIFCETYTFVLFSKYTHEIVHV